MALTVAKRPQGFINSATAVTGTYTNGSSVITKVGHGLITGKTIYITANQAIGFWYVTPLTVDTFNIREYAGATVYTFIGSGSFSYYGSVDNAGHSWNAVHLPIVYKLTSNLWPTNTSDTSRTVSSHSNDNGYTRLTLSGAITASVTELEFIKITGNQAGVYQILSWWSTSQVTINLAYNANYTWSGGTVIYYYNNYHARIRVYAGLAPTHFYATQKPYTLLCEIKAVPDTSGVVTVNINEYLKSKIEVLKNDLLKGTLQNNLDAFCQFYITYAEGYDYSAGGYSLLDFISSYTDDSTSFQGYAVNADLPFKNLYSGYLSEFVYGSSATKLKFLTPSIYPVLNAGQFFDISFVNQIGARLRMKREVYQGGTIVNLFFDDINDYGVGIYRYQVAQSIYLEDRIDLTLQWQDYSGYISISEVKTITVDTTCYLNAINLSWLNYDGGFDYFTFKTNADYGVDIEGTTSTIKNIIPTWPQSHGEGADTVKQETSRDSRQKVTVRAENVTVEIINDLYKILTSPLVQIVISATNRRTVIPDAGSFVYLQQSAKLFNLTFDITYTDLLPSQN